VIAPLLGGSIGVKLAALSVPAMLCVRLAGRKVPFTIAIAGLLAAANFSPNDGARVMEIRRSFFGVHRVVRREDGRFTELYHGTTLHGRQKLDSQGKLDRADEPLTYYHRQGPVGDVMASPITSANRPRNVGVIGLGVGSIAAYANSGDHYTFYEIDPAVRWVADGSGHFSYLAAAQTRGARVDVVLGDARLTIATAPPRGFDVLVLDAFSGDAIPLHLLTREAVATYLDKLADDGVLLAHVSNLYLDLEPVLARLAEDAGCDAFRKEDLELTESQSRDGKTPSKWIAISRRGKHPASVFGKGWETAKSRPGFSVWTDDFSNILSTLR
jgi:spermidine synthase